MQGNNFLKSKKLKILVRLDASHHLGLAHAVRTSELLRHVKASLDIHLCGSGAALKLFFDKNVTFHDLAAQVQEMEKTRQTIQLAQEIAADVILIDQPEQTCATWQCYYDNIHPVIALDDYGGDIQADLVFNGTILDSYHQYPLVSEKTSIHCGGNYALINPVFRNITQRKSEGKKILIVIGGGDRAKQWAFALTGDQSPFQNAKDCHITMIVGGTFPEMTKLQYSCANLGIELHRNIQQKNLARLLSSHSIALITGGMVVYETLASGCPAIIFPQEKNLIREAQWFAENDSLINLGYDGGMDMKIVKKKVALLCKDNKLIQSLSSKGCELIDGMGMSRTAKKMDQFLSTIKRNNTST